jgi:hypothetical protein
MPSSACQDVIVSLPIRGGATVFMNVSMCESCDLDRFFHVAKFTSLRLLSLLLMYTLISLVSLKISSLPNTALKSPNKILM